MVKMATYSCIMLGEDVRLDLIEAFLARHQGSIDKEMIDGWAIKGMLHSHLKPFDR